MNARTLILLAVGGILFWLYTGREQKSVIQTAGKMRVVSNSDDQNFMQKRDQLGNIIYGDVGLDAHDSMNEYIASGTA